MRPGQTSPEQTFTTRSSEETILLGRELARMLAPSRGHCRMLILRGDLGAGKTTLVKGIAAGLDAADPEDVTSPTFTLIHEYEGAEVRLYHLDLYRLETERELLTLGLEELEAPGSLILVEWGEKFPSVVARAEGAISISINPDETRTVALRLG